MTTTTAPNESDTNETVPEVSAPARGSRILWLVPVLAAAALGVAYLRAHRGTPPHHFVTTRVAQGSLVETVEATGSVEPVTQVQVGAQISGRISRVNVDFNSRVHRGDLLAEIDPLPYQTVVEQARASLLSARASLARARADADLQEHTLARALELQNRRFNAVSDVEAARGARDAAQAQVQLAAADVARAEAALGTARANLAYCRIEAPIDGIVISRTAEVGQTVAASFTAPVLFVIANELTRMRVIADIDEADVGRIREGMTANARVDAFPGETFRGAVQELRFGPSTSQGVVTYPAVIEIPNPDLRLRPGMTATVSVITASHDGVLTVPNGALHFHPTATSTGAARPEETEATPNEGHVYIARDGVPVRLPVHLGISDGNSTEVSGGEIRPGLEVILRESNADDSASNRGSRGGT